VKFRIDTTSDENGVTVMHVTGHLSQDFVPQLLEAADSVAGSLVLDLSALVFADAAGTAALRALAFNRAEIRGASTFVRLLLESADEKDPQIG